MWLAALSLHSAASRTRAITSSDRRGQRDLDLRHHRREIAHHEGDFGVRLGRRRVILRGRGAARRGFGQHALRIERRNIGGQIGDGQRQVAGDAQERAHADDFMIAGARDGRDADHLARERRFVGGRQTIALAHADLVAADAERAAQRDLDALRQRREIGFAVERRENGAAHQSSAAQRGQNRAGKPLHRDAAAIDVGASAAVDRQRRLVAELDGVGMPRSICAARPCMVQARRPLRLAIEGMACRNQISPSCRRQAA